MMDAENLPNVFCWTKMGDEAGQPLDAIIARKEAEREIGGGVFFWGIGTSLGKKIWGFIDSCTRPYVLFSPMKAKPKHIDRSPEKVFIWTAYLDRHGIKHAMPGHVLVTSRGVTNGLIKGRHYALVCQKSNSLHSDEWPSVDWEMLKNYNGNSKLGFSQVTAVVELKETETSAGRHYDILFGAELVAPYYVTLVEPVELPKKALARVNELCMIDGCDAMLRHEKLRSVINGFCALTGLDSENINMVKRHNISTRLG